jgi:hypothetical protein
MSDLELALALAGANRPELEKVLAHYSADAADSLKYRAACFLIENMIYHYEACHPKLDSIRYCFVKDLSQKEMTEQIIKWSRKEITGYTKKPDVLHIKSGYLIRNIDFSFRIWKEVPWSSAIPFDDFCEQILPYRLSNEPLEDWKETYYYTFRPVIDSIAKSNDIRQICSALCNHLRKSPQLYLYGLDIPGIGALTLLNSKLNSKLENCREGTEYMTYILRSLGIPTYIDKVLQNANNNWKMHYWNIVNKDPDRTLFIDDYSVFDKLEDFNKIRKLGKIYRKYCAVQKESLLFKKKAGKIPDEFADPYLSDISYEYFPDINITIPATVPLKKEETVYLTVFDDDGWSPTGWTVKERGKLCFRSCEPDGYIWQA